MKRTPFAASFHPQLEMLESREAPASTSSSSLFGNLLGSSGSLQLPTRSMINTMQNQNTKLTTDQQTYTSDINNKASSQTIAGDFGLATSAFGKIKTLNTQVQNLVHLGQLGFLGVFLASQGKLSSIPGAQNALSTLGLQNLVGGQHQSQNNNDDDESNNNHRQGLSSQTSSTLSTLSLAGLFLLSQESQQATNIFDSASTTANTPEPNGFPTIASKS